MKIISVFARLSVVFVVLSLLQACATRSGSVSAPVSFQWNHAGHVALSVEPGSHHLIDWDNGIWQIDVNVHTFDRTGMDFVVVCGEGCARRVPVDSLMPGLIEQGWQRVNIPLNCFVHEGDDFRQQSVGFGVFASGTGKLDLRHHSFASGAQPNVTCPDYANMSVTPGMLNTWWARDWWLPRHEAKKQEALERKINLVMLGDSITQGWENEGKESWEKYYAPRGAINLGFGGDRTENVLWRLQHGALDNIDPRLVVLMIGTNNTGHRMDPAENTARGIRHILNELHERAPNARVLLLGVFPRDAKPGTPMRLRNQEINQLIAGFADNDKVFYLDINQIFLDEQGYLSTTVMPDLLHLNSASYAAWADAIEPWIKKLMKE